MEERGGASGMAYVGGLGNVAKVLLLLLNMAFMVAGCLLVYFSHRVKTSGWLDAFQGDYEWIGTSTLILTLVLGAVVIALAALGCFGAPHGYSLRRGGCGCAYGQLQGRRLEQPGLPATDNEASLGTNFNRLYCYAQVPYYCQDASVNTVLEMFNVSLAGYFTDTTTNFTNVCATVTLAAINDICAVCDLVSQYDEYSVVLDWTEASCPRTSANQIWCGGFLLNATAADDMSTSAPFMECRGVFYDLVEKWTNVIMVASIICIIAAVMVLAMTGVLWKNVRVARQEKAMPPAPAPMYQYADQNPGYSQRSEAQNSNNFSMVSTAPYAANANTAHRRYDSPY
ncbi:MORN repeat-containing protein 5 [Phytophthora nicotianae]|uniref:MORN repeat-containing protein 5 n=1 Tax=Phytophthora nicotianae TaxID=4792 RepID=A0A0W8DLQ9_PHYNI|nr:MORN repeat-containing protein 5 [Phytophthora nicotianae]